MRTTPRLSALALVLTLGLALAGCAPAQEDAPQETVQPTDAPEASGAPGADGAEAGGSDAAKKPAQAPEGQKEGSGAAGQPAPGKPGVPANLCEPIVAAIEGASTKLGEIADETSLSDKSLAVMDAQSHQLSELLAQGPSAEVATATKALIAALDDLTGWVKDGHQRATMEDRGLGQRMSTLANARADVVGLCQKN